MSEVDGLIERLGNLLAADSTDKCLIRVTNGDVRAAIYGLRRLQRELQEQQRLVEFLVRRLEEIEGVGDPSCAFLAREAIAAIKEKQE